MMKKKKYNYFQSFQLMTECAYQASTELMKTLKDYQSDKLEGHLQKMHRIEHDSDTKRHDIMSVLAKDSRPPMDREDIVELSNALDDMVDMIEDVSIGLYIYNVTELECAAQAYGKVILMCSDAVREMMVEFEKLQYNESIMNCIKRVNHLEGQGDTLFAETTRDIFVRDMDTVDVIKWKSMYDRMEQACDACEKVSHLVESVLLKNS